MRDPAPIVAGVNDMFAVSVGRRFAWQFVLVRFLGVFLFLLELRQLRFVTFFARFAVIALSTVANAMLAGCDLTATTAAIVMAAVVAPGVTAGVAAS